MKIFIAVIIAATIIGGFVGAEFMNNIFSITGAVIGGVGTAAILLGLGAFFDAQEKRKKEKELPPEMRKVFDRMLGQQSPTRTKRASQSTTSRSQSNSASAQDDPLGIFSDDPIGNTIKNLAKQQVEAAARGERVTNRLPKFVQINSLKLSIVKMLQGMSAESIGVNESLYQRLLAIDTEGGLGLIAKDFDAISNELPEAVLSTIESKVRAIDSTKLKPNFNDIAQIFES